MLFCSIFSARSSLISDGATKREKRGEEKKARGRREMSLGNSSLIQYDYNSLTGLLKDIRNSLYSPVLPVFTQSRTVQAKVKGGAQGALSLQAGNDIQCALLQGAKEMWQEGKEWRREVTN